MQKKLLLLTLATVLLTGCIPTKKQDSTVSLTKEKIVTITPTPAPIEQKAEVNPMEKIDAKTATIKTSKGDITIELYPDETPLTVQNFLTKAKSDYYKNLIFHRVESWVLQGGDPKGTGTGGGPLPTELSARQFEIGSVGVARGGDIKVSNDSQFFICTDDCSWLTGQYTNFGKVTKGMDVAKKMQVGDTILGITYTAK